MSLLGISISLVLLNCEQEEDVFSNSIEPNEVENFKNKFDSFYINQALSLGEDNLQIEWHSEKVIEFSKKDSTTVYEFNAYLKKPIIVESEELYKENTYKLIVIEQANSTDFKVLRFEPLKNSINVAPTYKNTDQFSGDKFELNQLGKVQLLATYKDGEVINYLSLAEEKAKIKVRDKNDR